MTLGAGHESDAWLGLALGLVIIGTVTVIHVVATLASLHAPGLVHRALSALVDPPRRALLHHLTPVENFPATKISPYFRVNGYPPPRSTPTPATTTTSGSSAAGSPTGGWRYRG